MSGLSYSPPIYYFKNITYDPAFFANNNEISQAYLNQTFLPRIGIALSSATLTSFQGTVECYGLVSFYGGLSITGGLTLDTLTVNGLATFNTAPLMSGASITSNTIPALSIVNGSITQTQVSTGLSFVNLGIQNFGGAKTFNNSLTTNGITDNVSVSSPYYTATSLTTNSQFTSVNVSGNLFANNINTSASTPLTLAIGTTALPSGTSANAGLQIGWNGDAGTGETNFINLGQGGAGGFQFGTISNSLPYRALCDINTYANQGLWLFSNAGRLRIDDRNGGPYWWGQSQEGSQMLCSVTGVSTSFTIGCGDSSGIGSTCLGVDTTNITVYKNLNPTSTTTFNASHPTTSLGNNISTNTTEYATVGYINSVSGPTLLTSNNVWSGTNSYTQNQISIGSGVTQVYVGNSTGNQQSIVIGDPTSLATTTISTNCISVGTLSLRQSTGSNNISLGTANFPALTTGNNNISVGTSNGGGITTGLNNIIIGTSSWTSGNFSNCTVIGNVVPAPLASNSIILGSIETVYINGASQLNNTYLYGTTVVGNNFQVNGNIIQPIQNFTAGVQTTFSILPPFVFFTPIASMSFVWPAPATSNSGQTFTIRRIATGGGQTINNTIVGGISAWWLLSGASAISNIAISTVWSFTFISNGTGYYQIA